MNDVDKIQITKLHVWKKKNHAKLPGIYNSPQNNPALTFIDVSRQTIVVGDFNAHFHDVRYKNVNEAGKAMEDLI
jgi:hypothetical protein